jgi:hypothetical protein
MTQDMRDFDHPDYYRFQREYKPGLTREVRERFWIVVAVGIAIALSILAFVLSQATS